ncbi:hypothetical protein C8N43_3053 [Litoreibacter ponti]|uniref:HTH cro/C1-type domain-containing protein n=1 Tax=Litoreibacter ponti TaxID=1510457 RepID=A0A2T6BDU3_9RHOB|nr:helix-turn-helix transcriptional regulator [Litoreibacter ponti]PTX54241.1 hypothetical protein C8N43_3053 [Litoreibacter ponti]
MDTTRKTLVGPSLRQLRRDNRETQAQMAKRLGISAAYVNLLENNQRALSVQVLMAITETYGVDWRDLIADNDAARLADLRAALRDPVFGPEIPDLQELRAALDHAPRLVEKFLSLHRSHRMTMDRVMALGSDEGASGLIATSPETAIHDYFRNHGNHFDTLERRAEAIRGEIGGGPDDLYAGLKARLGARHGVVVQIGRIHDIGARLRDYDQAAGKVILSEALDHPNRVFQLCHVLALLEVSGEIDLLLEDAAIADEAGAARCRVELANYAAAAILMPYMEVLELAESTRYDLDRIAAGFGVSFEQVCHRLTTLQRDGARGVPFFFLRTDKAGNVTKRFNSTSFTLAEQGGACPVWNIHGAFRTPGVILPQFVELPEGGQFFTLSRTSDRPVFSRATQDRRLVVTLGCERTHAERIGYAAPFNISERDLFDPIGINCHLCPRQACSQRAHRPLHVNLPLDANRRGSTRYES